MNEEFYAHLLVNCIVYPKFDRYSEKINNEIQAHEKYISGMEFIGSFYSPERDELPINKFIYIKSWSEEEANQATAIYTEISRKYEISEAVFTKIYDEENI